MHECVHECVRVCECGNERVCGWVLWETMYSKNVTRATSSTFLHWMAKKNILTSLHKSHLCHFSIILLLVGGVVDIVHPMSFCLWPHFFIQAGRSVSLNHILGCVPWHWIKTLLKFAASCSIWFAYSDGAFLHITNQVWITFSPLLLPNMLPHDLSPTLKLMCVFYLFLLLLHLKPIEIFTPRLSSMN